MTGAGPMRDPTDDTLADALIQELRIARMDAAVVALGRRHALRPALVGRPAIYLMLAGEAAIETGSGTRAVLGPGDVAIMLYGDAHLIGHLPATKPAALRLDPEIDQPSSLEFGRPPWSARLLCCLPELGYVANAAASIRAGPPLWCMRAKPDADEAAGPALRLDCGQIAEALAGPGAAAFALALAGLLLVHGVRDMYRSVWHGAARNIRGEETRRLAAAIRAIQTHPDRNWTVAALAREVGLSRSSFAEAFTRAMQVPPLLYLHRVRMEQAARLLRRGSVSILEVGRRSGYPLPSSFSRAFKTFHGASPRWFAAHPMSASNPVQNTVLDALPTLPDAAPTSVR